ncbi:MAG: RNA polymerase sigma factor [Actinomycetota bacterium]
MLPPFQIFIEQHGDAVLRFLLLSVGPDEAEDCWQETFMAALRAYPRLERDTNLRAWALKIAQRKAIDAQRGRARRAQPSALLPDVEERDWGGGPEPGLWAAVKGLPAKQRAAVAARYVADLAYADVGAVVGCSEDAARQNVREGLKKLRKEFHHG